MSHNKASHCWPTTVQIERFIIVLNFSGYDQYTVTSPFSVNGTRGLPFNGLTVDVQGFRLMNDPYPFRLGEGILQERVAVSVRGNGIVLGRVKGSSPPDRSRLRLGKDR